MPELPEVEIIRRELSSLISGKIIKAIHTDEPKLLRPEESIFSKGVEGKKIYRLGRQAKLMIFFLEPSGYFIVHLKLTGRLFYSPDLKKKDSYVHVVMEFSDGSSLQFSSSRKFGYWSFIDTKDKLESILGDFGKEPLKDLDWDSFNQLISSRSKVIKTLLMDQKLISGIGNIYANDALWMAKIHPERLSNSLSEEESRLLWESINCVLREALELKGSSDQWYRRPLGEKGGYQDHFKVYGRTGENCVRCGTEIKYKKIGGRGSFWCPQCQTLKSDN